MARKKVIDKQFKLDAVQYRKNHPELTFEQVARNLRVSNSSIHRRCKQFSDTKTKNESRDLFRGSGNFSSDDAKESKYIAEARSIYIVVQTEEAKWRAENGKKSTDECDQSVYDALSTTTTTGSDNQSKKSDGTVAEKTDFKDVTISKPTKGADGKYTYTFKWTSDRAVEATLTSNKDVKIK